MQPTSAVLEAAGQMSDGPQQASDNATPALSQPVRMTCSSHLKSSVRLSVRLFPQLKLDESISVDVCFVEHTLAWDPTTHGLSAASAAAAAVAAVAPEGSVVHGPFRAVVHHRVKHLGLQWTGAGNSSPAGGLHRADPPWEVVLQEQVPPVTREGVSTVKLHLKPAAAPCLVESEMRSILRLVNGSPHLLRVTIPKSIIDAASCFEGVTYPCTVKVSFVEGEQPAAGATTSRGTSPVQWKEANLQRWTSGSATCFTLKLPAIVSTLRYLKRSLCRIIVQGTQPHLQLTLCLAPRANTAAAAAAAADALAARTSAQVPPAPAAAAAAAYLSSAAAAAAAGSSKKRKVSVPMRRPVAHNALVDDAPMHTLAETSSGQHTASMGQHTAVMSVNTHAAAAGQGPGQVISLPQSGAGSRAHGSLPPTTPSRKRKGRGSGAQAAAGAAAAAAAGAAGTAREQALAALLKITDKQLGAAGVGEEDRTDLPGPRKADSIEAIELLSDSDDDADNIKKEPGVTQPSSAHAASRGNAAPAAAAAAAKRRAQTAGGGTATGAAAGGGAATGAAAGGTADGGAAADAASGGVAAGAAAGAAGAAAAAIPVGLQLPHAATPLAMTQQLQQLLMQLKCFCVMSAGYVSSMMGQLQQRLRPLGRVQLEGNEDWQWVQTDYVCLQNAVAGGTMQDVVSTLKVLVS